MNDKTDPRLDVLRRSVSYHLTPEQVAADLDAADRAAGIVRVDTHDEALVDRVAQNWCVHEGVGKNCQPCWFDADNFLAALREAT